MWPIKCSSTSSTTNLPVHVIACRMHGACNNRKVFGSVNRLHGSHSWSIRRSKTCVQPTAALHTPLHQAFAGVLCVAQQSPLLPQIWDQKRPKRGLFLAILVPSSSTLVQASNGGVWHIKLLVKFLEIHRFICFLGSTAPIEAFRVRTGSNFGNFWLVGYLL